MGSENADVRKRAEILSLLFGCYGQGKDSDRLAIYGRLLKDVPVELLGRTCNKLMIECKFLPSVAEIIEASRELMGEVDESRRVKPWGEAWAEIERAACGRSGMLAVRRALNIPLTRTENGAD